MFTDSKKIFDKTVAFKEAAIADGWEAESMYKNEDISQACALTRDGYHMQILTRDFESEPRPRLKPRHRYECDVSIWGPDRLAIKPPEEYNSEMIIAGCTTCNLCGATDVETHRYSFAGRACDGCLPAAKAEHEKPGWNN